MKKICMIVFLIFCMAAAPGSIIAEDVPPGPAPDSGDCIPDGSGFEGAGNIDKGSGNGPVGPAPESGDGVPNGSGINLCDDLPPYLCIDGL